MATPTIVFAPQALDIVRRAGIGRGPSSHDDAVGGLLIGKRVGDEIMVLAATEPGPSADDRRLGVALDVQYINAILEAWFVRDADADIVGMWHNHPYDLHDLTLDDVAAAYTLREDSGREIVSAIAVAGDEQSPVRCFYLDATNAQTVGLVPVPHTIGGDEPVVTPVFPPVIEPALAGLQSSVEPALDEPVGPRSSHTEPAVVPPSVSEAHVSRVYDTGTNRTTDDTDPSFPPVPTYERTAARPARRSTPSRQRAIKWILYALVALFLLFGLLRFCGRSGAVGGSGSDLTETTTTVASVVAIVESRATASPAATSTSAATSTVVATETPVLPTDTAVPSPTTAATPTEVAASTIVPVAPALSATTTVSATTTPEGPPLPYVVTWEQMPPGARTTFLARARAANCADCFNVDLIGPEPYTELLVRIDGGPALHTFNVPALANVAPRDEPHTLQAFDAQNNAVSPEISVDADPGSYYILRIVAP